MKTLKCNVINVINHIFLNYFSLKNYVTHSLWVSINNIENIGMFWNLIICLLFYFYLILLLLFKYVTNSKSYTSTSWPNSNEDMSFTNHFVWRYCISWQISNILYVRRCGLQNTTNSNVRKFVSLNTLLFPLVQKYEKIKAI